MDTRTDDEPDAVEPAPPEWLLRTPTRRREVWTRPLLVLVLAAGFFVLGDRYGGTLALVVGVLAAAITSAAAVTLAVTGRAAHAEQTWGASWRHHVALVVTGVTLGAVVGLAGLVVAGSIGFSLGLLVTVPTVFRFSRVVPRFDHLAVAWASVVMASSFIVVLLLGLAVRGLPEYRASAWVGVGGAAAAFAAVVAIVEFRRAARTPSDWE